MIADALVQAHMIGTRYGQALTEKQERGVVSSIKDFLGRAHDIVTGIVDRIREAISDALSSGDEDIDPEQIVQDTIDGEIAVLPDLVAETEIVGEVENTVLGTLKDAGVSQVIWVTNPGACQICLDNEEQGAINIGDAFASGHTEPPAHPRCRCNLSTPDEEASRMQRVVVREEVKENFTYLFCDIDGVFSIANAGLPEVMIDGKEAWPVPQANAILQAIDSDKNIRPVWMTHWGKLANGWCHRAGLLNWSIWYPLTLEEDETEAQRLYPDLGKKAQAIQYCLHVNRGNIRSALWLQDGYTPEEREWAEQAGVRLVNANEEPIHSLLLSENESAVQRLMDLLVVNSHRIHA